MIRISKMANHTSREVTTKTTMKSTAKVTTDLTAKQITLSFFMPMNPPTATAQETQCTIGRDGKRRYYRNHRLVQAQQQLAAGLVSHVPAASVQGPIRLEVVWLFSAKATHGHGEWRTTRPDTDNLNKLLKDTMTKLHFWKDDSQVVSELIHKLWTKDTPGIWIRLTTLPAIADLPKPVGGEFHGSSTGAGAT